MWNLWSQLSPFMQIFFFFSMSVPATCFNFALMNALHRGMFQQHTARKEHRITSAVFYRLVNLLFLSFLCARPFMCCGAAKRLVLVTNKLGAQRWLSVAVAQKDATNAILCTKFEFCFHASLCSGMSEQGYTKKDMSGNMQLWGLQAGRTQEYCTTQFANQRGDTELKIMIVVYPQEINFFLRMKRSTE